MMFCPASALLSSLPGGDTLIKARQIRLMNRLNELNAVAQLRKDLQATHLDERTGEEMLVESEGVAADEAASPRIKRLLSSSTVRLVSLHPCLPFVSFWSAASPI